MKKKRMRRKRKEGFCKRNYRESFKFIRESKNQIFLVIALFVIFALVGYFFPIFFSEQFTDLLRELVLVVSKLSTLPMIGYLFANNVMTGFFALLFGSILGILPLIATIMNGYFLGYASNLAVSEAGLLELWKLLPHGIFELPAALISFGIGLKLGVTLFRNYIDFYKKNSGMILAGIVSIITGLMGILFLQSSLISLLSPKIMTDSLILQFSAPAYYLSMISLLLLGLILVLPFVSLFLGGKKDLCKENMDVLFKSVRTFVFVVIPLLVIAAIIEGILIAFLK